MAVKTKKNTTRTSKRNGRRETRTNPIAKRAGRKAERRQGGVLRDSARDEVFRLYRHGATAEELAERFQRSKSTVYRVIQAKRVERVLETPIDFVYNDEFDARGAEKEILGPAPEPSRKPTVRKAPAGLPPYLASLYSVPLLTREQEFHYFRKMNYLKYRAAKLRDRLNPKRVDKRKLERIEDWMAQARQVRNLLVRRNLRLVVSIAKKYVAGGGNLFEMISDGNVSLMRAIDKFDYGKGFKLSTYATWAITRNFARSVPTEQRQLQRFRTGTDEAFMFSEDEGRSEYEQQLTNRHQREALSHVLDQLRERDREILVSRYGLAEGTEPKTLEKVGEQLGVSKERIRQLEARALKRVREIIADEQMDIPGL